MTNVTSSNALSSNALSMARGSAGAQAALGSAAHGVAAPKPPADASTRDAFQEFVAGTFFQQMFKSLRDTQQKPKYFHGGQAEEIFQNQLDQTLATELAKQHGDALAGQLYKPFVQNARVARPFSRDV